MSDTSELIWCRYCGNYYDEQNVLPLHETDRHLSVCVNCDNDEDVLVARIKGVCDMKAGDEDKIEKIDMLLNKYKNIKNEGNV